MRRLGPVLVQCINPSPGVFRGGVRVVLLFPVSSGSLSFPIVRYETMLVVDTV